ncbi:MAG: GGDEF domain-containing protein, partial [Planctomycetaceae bacterium]|nr:GGDEF domain-containing protein [Planctomycetaceae bacterium]
DRLLKEIGASLRRTIRAMDAPARMGGDEFAVLLPAADREEAQSVIQRIRDELNSAMRRHAWPVTFSVGVVIYEDAPESVEELIHRADLLMYDVKRGKKDAVAYRLCV